MIQNSTVRLSQGRMAQSTGTASVLMCAGLVVTYLMLPDEGAVAIYRAAAIGAALAIGFGIFLEVQGVRSLVRTDLLMLIALFGLTLVEFFFPQEAVEQMVTAQNASQGVEVLFLGFCGLIIGRNFASKPRSGQTSAAMVQLSPRDLFRLFVLILCLGYLNMLLSVNFNPFELVREMLQPRFSQAWSRGSLGGWGDLLGEFSGLLLYLVPAIAGAVLAHRSRYTILQVGVVLFGLLFTLFYAFSGGTRNVFCIYLVILIASYVLLKPNITWKSIAVISCFAAVILYLAAYYMLQFRTVGLEGYVQKGGETGGFRRETLFIDNNLPVISLLTDVFPRTVPFLGSEIAFWAILHPVPRALWPSKPEHLSVETADALGLKGLTVSSTFVGKSYMMGGSFAVLAVGLLFGWLAGWWNKFGSDLQSNVSVALYASGFFAAMLSMRSMLWTTTAMLPTFALWLYARSRRRQVSGLPPTHRKHRI